MLPNHCSHARPRINRPRDRRRSKLPASLALLALALLAAPHAARARARPQVAAASASSAASELKVMTWNMRGGNAIKNPGEEPHTQACKLNPDPNYLKGIEREIRGHAGLDVVALQEVYQSQADLLRTRLAGHMGRRPSLYFVATINCKRIDDKYGIAIISRYQFSAGSGKSVGLCRSSSDKPALDERPFTAPTCPRDELRVLARVIIVVGGRPVHIYNTHLPPKTGVHSGMMDVIFSQVKRDRPDRAVLLGDFYAPPGSAGYYKLTGGRFRDAWLGAGRDRKACDAEGSGFTHPTLNVSRRFDYVFIGKGFRVADAWLTCTEDLREVFGLPKRGPSRDPEKPLYKSVPDHLPLTVRLALVDAKGK
jgi:endonuclease/exonuclease/phosphatase family metal-dependent hydrolase